MIIGLISDTHEDTAGKIPAIIEEFRSKRKVDLIVHCGDITPPHVNPEIFGGFPVICALNKEQIEEKNDDKGEIEDKNEIFKRPPPPGWIFTRPGEKERVVEYDNVRMYAGHKRSFDVLSGSEEKFQAFLHSLRRDFDGLRWVFSGHTHHQVFVETQLVRFVNPGAVQDSFCGYEFATVNTDNLEIVFSRIPKIKPMMNTFSVGIISDTCRISEFDPDFWKLLAEEFRQRDVSTIIHCGNIALCDIGRPELDRFKVYYNLRQDQLHKAKHSAHNWQLVGNEKGDPLVEIGGYHFYVELDLSLKLLEQSECDMDKFTMGLRRKYNEIDFILCGFTHHAMCVEQLGGTIINPGDAIDDRNFAVLCLPRKEITFGRVPLPSAQAT